MRPFKKGMIILWHGSIATIPNKWALCDGNNGTPDLRNSFVVCAGDTYDPADTGGSTSHVHAGETDHYHSVSTGKLIAAGSGYGRDTDSAKSVGDTGSASTLPVYYALAYIMKL